MNLQSSVFAQLLSFVPLKHFEYLVRKYAANHGTHCFTAWSHFVAMSYAQLTRRDGLRDLVVCLNSHSTKLYHVGLRHKLSRSTLADANERRDWRLFEALGKRLFGLVQRGCSFMVRAKENMNYSCSDWRAVDNRHLQAALAD